MTRKLYQILAGTVAARENCRGRNPEWFDRHGETIAKLVRDYLPSGSGFDSGTSIDLDNSTPDCLRFETAFHHMNDAGFYEGWTPHKVVIRPSLSSEFYLHVTGPNKRDIKEYIAECFDMALRTELVPDTQNEAGGYRRVDREAVAL